MIEATKMMDEYGIRKVCQESEVRSLEANYKNAVDAIKSALRIEELWIPAVAGIEHEGEVQALHKMRDNFLKIIKESP